MSEYLCNHTRGVYIENDVWDYVGYDLYNLETYYEFRCLIMPWYDDKI